MEKIDMHNLYEKFYVLVNKMILFIHESNISKYLNECAYYSLNDGKNYYYPLTICLGGSGFIQYNHIFIKEKLIDKVKLESLDYDISLSLKYVTNANIDNIIKEIKEIYDKLIVKFTYDKISINNFNLTHIINEQRIHFRIECNPYYNLNDNLSEKQRKSTIHILELSFWFNGKVSDNFTINDFEKNELYLYKNNNLYYYLLPLDLLVKTLLYAIVDFFERRNFYKCNKYLDRIKFIKDCNKLYIDNKLETNNCLLTIFDSYKNKIKRKYKMIQDYPFIIAKTMKEINNNGVIKCIYRKLRKRNKKYINKEIDKYKEECKDSKHYKQEFSEMTPEDSDLEN
jgi:hypothetical protein